MSRTKEMMSGITAGLVNISVSYIVKLQKRLALTLMSFMTQLRSAITASDLVHWDDTVIKIDKRNACLRVYVSGDFAYYSAHKQKTRKDLIRMASFGP